MSIFLDGPPLGASKLEWKAWVSQLTSMDSTSPEVSFALTRARAAISRIEEREASLHEELLCEALRLKIAKALPADLMPEFQTWLSLEQSIAYARGRQDEAGEGAPLQFEATSARASTE